MKARFTFSKSYQYEFSNVFITLTVMFGDERLKNLT